VPGSQAVLSSASRHRWKQFKASNTRDRNFTTGKIDKRQQQIKENIQRYLSALETADRTQPPEVEAKTTRLREKIAKLQGQMRHLEQVKEELKTLYGGPEFPVRHRHSGLPPPDTPATLLYPTGLRQETASQ
jgi:hypothetical protein